MSSNLNPGFTINAPPSQNAVMNIHIYNNLPAHIMSSNNNPIHASYQAAPYPHSSSSSSSSSPSSSHMQHPPTTQTAQTNQTTQTNQPVPTLISYPPGLINNQRMNFSSPANNMTGTLEIRSIGPRNTGMYSQIDEITRNIVDSLSNLSDGNDNSNMENQNGLNLPEIRRHTSLILSSDSNSNCEICHDTIQQNDILRVLNECSHSFHQECIDAWLESHNSCPYCRTDIISSSATDTAVADTAVADTAVTDTAATDTAETTPDFTNAETQTDRTNTTSR